jgi:hypothetical protein
LAVSAETIELAFVCQGSGSARKKLERIFLWNRVSHRRVPEAALSYFISLFVKRPQMRTANAHLKSISREELDAVLSKVTEFLRNNWTTGGGRPLRHFVWSLWNGWQIMLSKELSNTEKRDRLRALIPADVCKIDDLNQAPRAQLTQLQGAIAAALALQKLDAEDFKKSNG